MKTGFLPLLFQRLQVLTTEVRENTIASAGFCYLAAG